MPYFDPSIQELRAQADAAETELATARDPDLRRYLQVVANNRRAEAAAREASARRGSV